MLDSLQVPALRGVMGDWVFYVTLLPLKEVCRRIKRTDEVHTSQLLKEWIQRALTNRSDDIAHYLKSHSQRFFNSLVVGVYEGNPEWHQISLRKSPLFDPLELDERVSESLGFLVLSGAEKLFAIDGQHRVEGIKRFMNDLKGEEQTRIQDEICAIFVAHKNTQAGIQRTRRLFSTLNRTAKPVSLTEIIALDEDDIVAIVCRSLIEEHPLFKDGRISIARQKAISSDDQHSITSLVALHQTMNIYLADRKGRQWERFRSLRPPEELVESFAKRGHRLWDTLVDCIPELQLVLELRSDQNLPSGYRSERDGGDLLFRPIFPPIIARCLRVAERNGMTEKMFIRKLAKVPRALNKPPWLGLLWDGNMITRSKNQRLAEALILWVVGAKSRYDAAYLKLKFAEILSKRREEIVLPERVS